MGNNFLTVGNINDLPDLISDSDGVITDFSTAFHAYMADIHGHVAHVNEPENYNYSDAYPNHPEPWVHIKEFVNNPVHFGSVKIYREAIDALKVLHDAGVKIRILTATGDSRDVINTRLDCFNEHLSRYVEDVQFLPFGALKTDALKRYPPGFFIDDLVRECHGALSANHKPFLFHRRYNASATLLNGVHRLKSGWSSLPYFHQRKSSG
ncbi:hypothetical protein [Alteromonas sp. 14N.309.X.WAT.G.H12]|uniref:hypothetical protein n=1 Tax=Alteromonas sp. 14N.309.X.WAT.G.H12 TaxID=3120824 RepID=UPI002FD63E53